MQDEKGCDYPKPQQTQSITYLGLLVLKLFGIVVVSVIVTMLKVLTRLT